MPPAAEQRVPTSADQLRQRAAHHAVGRLGTIDEMADTVCYLLSAQSSFIVGQAISADGGWNV